MNIALLAGVWLLLGVIFCLVSGRSISGQLQYAEPVETSDAPVAARQFVDHPAHAWALTAHEISMDELLTTRPGAIRRVVAKD